MLGKREEDTFTKKTVEKRRLGEPTGVFKGAAWGALLNTCFIFILIIMFLTKNGKKEDST